MDHMYRSQNTQEAEREWHTMVEIPSQHQYHHQQQHQQQQDHGNPSIEGGTPSSALVRSASMRRRSGRRGQIASSLPRDGNGMISGRPTGIEQQPQSENLAPGVNIYPNLAEVVEDLENIRPLHEKIARQKQMKRVNETKCASCLHVTLPRLFSRIKAIKSWELWKGNMKYIQSHYGTGVLSYYVFLRWLMYLNLILFILWTSFVIIPQAVWRSTAEGQTAYQVASASSRTCIFQDFNASLGVTLCPRNETVFSATNCNNPQSTFASSQCFQDGSILREGNPVLQVARECNLTSVPGPTQWILCLEAQPPLNVGEYLLWFISGEGFFNTTELFIGIYTNATFSFMSSGPVMLWYNMPLAYLFTGGAVYIISLLAIVFRLGSIYHDNYLNTGRGLSVDFLNKLFCGWDYNIVSANSAKRRHAAIRLQLKEIGEEVAARHKKRNYSEWCFVITIRIFTNLFVVLCLAAGAGIIYGAVYAELQVLDTSLLSATVIAILNIVLPFIFEFLPYFERYRKKNDAIKMTLFRLLLVRLSSLITLLAVILIQIQCTQPVPEQKGTECSVDFTLSGIFNSSEIRGGSACPVCWETVIGQKFYELTLFAFVINTIGTIIVDTGRNIASRIDWPIIGKRISREFDIPKNILDLVYLQAILWLGFFFSPVIPGIVLVNMLILFYVKMISMVLNLEPSKEAYKAAKKDFTFQLILLLTVLACMLPVGFAIARMVPSQRPGCGPFRDSNFIYTAVEDWMMELTCAGQAAIGFFLSAGFVVPVVLLMLMMIVGLWMAFKARGRTVVLLNKQLKLESVDKTYLFERVMTLPVDVNRMRMESSHHASQDSADGTHETPGVTVRQLFATGALTDGSATGGWAENKQSKANFFKKMSASESVAMTDL